MTSYAVIGLGFGDEGKGATVDWLCRETGIETVVRFSGGCQAGHNVVTPEGLHHTFSQFGSGTFAGARTIHTSGMMIEPYSFMAEAEALKGKGVDDPLSLVDFDIGCIITTPYHWIINQMRENARSSDKKHGSCGRGIGETRRMQLVYNTYVTVGDLTERVLRDRLKAIRELCLVEFPHADLPKVDEVAKNYWDFVTRVNIVEDATHHAKDVIFEGSQGILLDETWGFHPHTTWSNLIPNIWGNVRVIGCTRTYATRHGPGPFPSEASLKMTECHNPTGRYQGAFRVGHLDLTLLNYAIDVLRACSINDISLAINHLDESPQELHRNLVDLSGMFEDPSLETSERLGRLLAKTRSIKERDFSLKALHDTPVHVTGHGPTWRDRIKVG